MTFSARLVRAVERHGHLCVGIDPHPNLLRDWGLPETPEGLERFAMTAVEALVPQVAVLKPQSAFFERFGSRGIAVLERVLAAAREGGALTLLDVKRGDIGSTSQAYADAYLDPASPLRADAITVSPYLGFGSLDPFFDTARRHDAGVFVLALTSNPEGPQVQHALDNGGRVGERILQRLAALNAGAEPLGSFGAVVGATITPPLDPRVLDINGPILAPGYGAQGGTDADLERVFGGASRALVLPSSSREILAAGPSVAALVDQVRRVQGR